MVQQLKIISYYNTTVPYPVVLSTSHSVARASSRNLGETCLPERLNNVTENRTLSTDGGNK